MNIMVAQQRYEKFMWTVLQVSEFVRKSNKFSFHIMDIVDCKIHELMNCVCADYLVILHSGRGFSRNDMDFERCPAIIYPLATVKHLSIQIFIKGSFRKYELTTRYEGIITEKGFMQNNCITAFGLFLY